MPGRDNLVPSVLDEVRVRREKEWEEGEIDREKLWHQGRHESHTLWLDFQEYITAAFKRTLNNATRTYKLITLMSAVMFALGIGLFVFAAVYATLAADAKVYSTLFAGMGAATFVAVFVLKPFDKAEKALADLIQAQVCFMTTFAQVRLWTRYSYAEHGVSDAAKADYASKQLMSVTRTSMALLDRYLEKAAEQSQDAQS